MNEPKSDATSVWTYFSESEADTARLGEALAGVLQSGDVVALVGTLGAGKTRLVQAVCEAAGISRRDVRSPTFTLVHEYEGRWPVYHFDTYRLGNPDEFLNLGAEEYLGGDGVCLIEWADKVAGLLPPHTLRIEIVVTGESEREFRFSTGDALSAARLMALRNSRPWAD